MLLKTPRLSKRCKKKHVSKGCGFSPPGPYRPQVTTDRLAIPFSVFNVLGLDVFFGLPLRIVVSSFGNMMFVKFACFCRHCRLLVVVSCCFLAVRGELELLFCRYERVINKVSKLQLVFSLFSLVLLLFDFCSLWSLTTFRFLCRGKGRYLLSIYSKKYLDEGGKMARLHCVGSSAFCWVKTSRSEELFERIFLGSH